VPELLDALAAVGEELIDPGEHHGTHYALATLTLDLGGFVIRQQRAHRESVAKERRK
jgi:hypothetical protein